VLLVSSSGGVILDVWALRPWWAAREHRWVCVLAADTEQLLAGEPVDWSPELKPGSILGLLQACAGAFRTLRAGDVDLVVSAGSGIAVPWFIAAYLCRVRRVWLETFNVIGRPGLASRLCAALASVVIVQHPHLMARHRRALLVEELY
jgi:UDP-N-acetylglucosamine:LPS N-acetylglucosamine transferase